MSFLYAAFNCLKFCSEIHRRSLYECNQKCTCDILILKDKYIYMVLTLVLLRGGGVVPTPPPNEIFPAV